MTTPNPLPAHKDRLKLDLTPEQARDILWGDAKGYTIISDTECGSRRWSIDHDLVIRRDSDGLFFRASYSVGATESQEESPWQYGAPDFRQCWPREKVVVAYV